MNELINKFLLARDKFMPEMHLKQPGFTYSACGPFTKNKERIQNFKETGDPSYIYKNEFDKPCFQHDMAYEDFKDLKIKKISDKILILDKSERKPNKIWVYKGSEFYNNYFQKWLKDNDIETYSIHNEGKSVVAERFMKTLKNKI